MPAKLEFVAGEERVKTPEIEHEEEEEKHSPKHEELLPEIEEENFENLDLPERRGAEEVKESKSE
jgi:hypothetical protein